MNIFKIFPSPRDINSSERAPVRSDTTSLSFEHRIRYWTNIGLYYDRSNLNAYIALHYQGNTNILEEGYLNDTVTSGTNRDARLRIIGKSKVKVQRCPYNLFYLDLTQRRKKILERTVSSPSTVLTCLTNNNESN